jgi:hypothetical protein
MKRTDPEKTYGACGKPEGHQDHLCLLMEKGLTEEVAQRTSRPAFTCGNCAAQANEREDLCRPVPIKKS